MSCLPHEKGNSMGIKRKDLFFVGQVLMAGLKDKTFGTNFIIIDL